MAALHLGLLILGIVFAIVGFTFIPMIALGGVDTIGWIVGIVGIIIVVIWAIVLICGLLGVNLH